MPFEFISSAESVAKQQQLWATLFGAAGIALFIFMQFKSKPPLYSLIGILLFAISGYFFYQSRQLSHNQGQWVIRINDQQIHWQSPDNTLDPSFTVDLHQIDYIDQSAEQSAGNDRPVYHLIMKNTDAIKLNAVSGINLNAFVTHLNQQGIETRRTNNYYLPVEQRQK